MCSAAQHGSCKMQACGAAHLRAADMLRAATLPLTHVASGWRSQADGGRGVKVLSARKGGPAALAGIGSQHYVQKIGGTFISTNLVFENEVSTARLWTRMPVHPHRRWNYRPPSLPNSLADPRAALALALCEYSAALVASTARPHQMPLKCLLASKTSESTPESLLPAAGSAYSVEHLRTVRAIGCPERCANFDS